MKQKSILTVILLKFFLSLVKLKFVFLTKNLDHCYYTRFFFFEKTNVSVKKMAANYR